MMHLSDELGNLGNCTEEVAPELGCFRNQPQLDLGEEHSRKKEHQKQTGDKMGHKVDKLSPPRALQDRVKGLDFI